MRLGILTSSNRWWIRAANDIMHAPIGPFAVMRYRPRFFGRGYASLLRRWLESPAHWSRGEMELFAAFVSKLNRCEY